MQYDALASIPMKRIGPIKIVSELVNESVYVPMATFESPLWPSTSRGAKVSRLVDGIHAVVVNDCMTRSVVVEATTALEACELVGEI